jgi:autotransporter-associated beta strand protein
MASAALWAGPSARAAQLFWDGASAPFPPASGGSGTWDQFSPNWATDSSGSSYTTWDNTNPSDAVFDVAAGTVTINSADNITATSLQFIVSGYSLTGSGSLTLTGAGTIGVNTGTAAIGNRIAGSVGLTKVGAGTLVLTGANTYTGTTNVNAGTLLLGGFGALASGNGLSVAGGVLNAGSIATSVSALSLNGGTIAGTGTVTTSGTMSFTGAGPVTMAGNAQIGVPMLFSSSVVFDEAASGNGTMNSVIDAPGQTFTKQGTGTLNMTIVATNTFSTTTVNSGTLAIVVDRNLGAAVTSPTSNAVTLNGGAIRATANSTYIPDSNRGWFIDTGGGTFDASFSSGTVIFGATLTGPGAFTKTGPTTVAVTNAGNTFSGGLLVNQGRWNVQATGATGTGPITLAPIGTSSVILGIGLTNAGATPVLSNNITLTPGTGTVSFEVNNSTPTQNVLTLNGQISGSSDLVKGQVATTTGVLVITNAANNYTGATKVLLGTLRTGPNNAGLPANSNLSLTGGSIYETSGSFTRALGTGGGQVQLGTGSAGFSAFGGPLTVDIGGDGSGTGPQLVWGSANFNPANTLILNGATANDTLTLRNAIDMGATNRTLQANAATAIVSGVISGTAGMIKGGAGVLQLSANNNFSGGFQINVGTLAISSDSNLGAASNSGTLAGGSGTLKTLAPVSSTRNLTVNAGAGNIDTDTFDSSFGQITGAGTLTKFGSGNLTVSTLRNQAMTVQAGKVSIAAGRSTANTSNIKALTITSGALNLNDQDLVIDYTGTSPLPAVQTALTSGFAGGSWTGSGINSDSAAAASSSAHKTALGYGEASAVFSAFPATFSGQQVDDTSVLVRYTYSGDANLDGKVDTLDFNSLAANFGGNGKVWTQADFNFDGVVDTLDFNSLAANFGQQLPDGAGLSAGGASIGTLVPEPASTALVALAFAAAAASRRRRRAR